MFNSKKKIHPITLVAITNIGKERDTNEDSVGSFIIDSQSFKTELNCGILVVADGMGGHEMGEVASDIAVKKFIEEVVHNIFHSSEDKDKLNFREILIKAIDASNREVWLLSKKKSSPIGTTLVGVIIVNKHVFIANVGDSRAYLIKPKRSILQITKDHSVVQEMLDGKMITKEQAKNHPRRNIITKALGLAESVKPDIFEVDMKDNILMLCSDGLYDMLDDLKISKTMDGNIYKSAEALISLANKNGGLDNISVAIASYND